MRSCSFLSQLLAVWIAIPKIYLNYISNNIRLRNHALITRTNYTNISYRAIKILSKLGYTERSISVVIQSARTTRTYLAPPEHVRCNNSFHFFGAFGQDYKSTAFEICHYWKKLRTNNVVLRFLITKVNPEVVFIFSARRQRRRALVPKAAILLASAAGPELW